MDIRSLHESIEKLNSTIKDLLSDDSLATNDTVDSLTTRVQRLKGNILKSKNETHVFTRLFASAKMWSVFYKIRTIDLALINLKTQAIKKSTILAIDKAIRDLQKKGFLLPMSPETCVEDFTKVLPELRTLGCSAVFNFRLVNRDQGQVELLVFSDEGKLSSYSLNLLAADEVQNAIETHANSAIPLSQLQDVSSWLHKHGAVNAPVLGRDAIEQKLEALMKSCPHGAYVLHAQNKTLTLSRLSPRGHIEHVIINLQKKLGCYTMEVEGTDIETTRVQFKRRLNQMGTPIRLVVANKS